MTKLVGYVFWPIHGTPSQEGRLIDEITRFIKLHGKIRGFGPRKRAWSLPLERACTFDGIRFAIPMVPKISISPPALCRREKWSSSNQTFRSNWTSGVGSFFNSNE